MRDASVLPAGDAPKSMGLLPGIGLVVANMIGAGVFLSTGFMAQDMAPKHILLAWVVGAALAMAGARAYAAVAELVPRSGGEYRYLSDLLHPALGYLAGWASLLVGFAAPVAVDALAAGSFASTLLPWLDPRLVGVGLIVALTALHVADARTSALTQNLLAGLKACLIIGFAAMGVCAGSHAWPTWQPPGGRPGFPMAAFAGSLFYITFAFSGWNAASYVAEEFKRPARDVPRSMIIGCGLVAGLYLVINWIFVANLDPAQAAAVLAYETKRVTLGHTIAQQLVGDAGARLMSAVLITLFISAISAMTFAGPHVYSAMARDGFLPPVFAGRRGGRPPAASVLLQSGLAVVITLTHSLQQALQNVGAILALIGTMTVLSLYWVRFRRLDLPRPPVTSLVAAALYAALTTWMLYYGFQAQTHLLAWVAVVTVAALAAYVSTRSTRPAVPAVPVPAWTAGPERTWGRDSGLERWPPKRPDESGRRHAGAGGAGRSAGRRLAASIARALRVLDKV